MPDRRTFLKAGLLLASSPPLLSRAGQDDDAEFAAIRDEAKAAGLGAIKRRAGEAFLVVGDASDKFLREAMSLLDGLLADYHAHFSGKGFAVAAPKGRLTVVLLSGPKAYASFLGVPPGEADGGHFDRGTNRLIM